MSSCRSSSTSAARLLALAVAAAGCGNPRVPVATAPAPARVAVFPTVNVGGGPAPGEELDRGVEGIVAGAGLEVVPRPVLEDFLARHRVRNTAGVDAETARAAREELGVDAVVLVSVGAYQPQAPPRLAVTLRLVSTGEPPRILWIDGAVRAGDEQPGLLGLGVIRDPARVQRIVLDRLGRSLRAYLRGGARAGTCEPERRFGPRLVFRSPRLGEGPFKVAVLPFVNETRRRSAGDAAALELVRQLSASPAVEVVEPGVVRSVLLENRLIMPGGVSLDVASTVLDKLDADLVVAGIVRRYEDGGGASSDAARVELAVQVLDRAHEVVAWSSVSQGDGGSGVWWFDLGRVQNSADLLCRVAASVVDRMDLEVARGSGGADATPQRSRLTGSLRRVHGAP
ncbi:lipoprotein, putative [Anaeromyxobacter dehalogenans 2CP-1]|uniref:Lipoprotein, putative n=1 Tax=Anaeromyxobacter dehalogenans (strain ATCC BAA-258 / DSM 21875 / 2CP-1) TaxID=455488 RepID=B8JGW0_ANAD2|nr:hypothetical protein [Anaeromyxobacter dehalogenans]ACL66597.1 lipoprotein, putative [Anaeromyxobacter dehalogenans 2CP-1]